MGLCAVGQVTEEHSSRVVTLRTSGVGVGVSLGPRWAAGLALAALFPTPKAPSAVSSVPMAMAERTQNRPRFFAWCGAEAGSLCALNMGPHWGVFLTPQQRAGPCPFLSVPLSALCHIGDTCLQQSGTYVFCKSKAPLQAHWHRGTHVQGRFPSRG